MSKIKLRIHTWPEKILRKKCRKVEVIDDELRAILCEMYLLMKASSGVGLAANQAGLDLSLIVVEHQNQTFKLVNPRIIKGKGTISFREGCLSFPGLELEIKRNNKIWISAQNEKGKSLNIEAEGLLAVIFQHEIDHLQGRVFIDRLSFWGKLRIALKLREIARRGKE